MAGQSIAPGDVISRVFRIYGEQASILLPAAVIIFNGGVLGLIASLIVLIATVFYQGMVVELVQDVQDGKRDSSLGDLFRSVSPVWLPLLAVSFLAGIGITIGFILIIIPGLILITIWSVVAPVTVLERPGVFAAFGRSQRLVKGSGWQVFGVIVIVFLLLMVAGIVAAAISTGLGDVGQAIVQWIANVVTAPVYALTASVLYFALRAARGESGAVAAGGPEQPYAPPAAPSTGPPTAS
jgi:hypothetical protein